MAAIPPLDNATLEAICAVLGDTATGLTGSEIGTVLRRCSIDDPQPGITKRHRLFEALRLRQAGDKVGNHVVAVIQAAMEPVRHIEKQAEFHDRRASLNQVLAFAGLTLGEDGKVYPVTAVQTVSEAQERAGRLRSELQRRRVHGDVLRACRAELLHENYFHAVLEATKSVAEKIRSRTALTTDGARLVDDALGLGQGYPRLAVNTLRSDSERSEHVGLMNLLKGMFSTFRNPTAHEPKIKWTISEEDALDLLSLVSLLHRRLDQATQVPTP
jgi:uncharacterized protein (TIGR02391 family)